MFSLAFENFFSKLFLIINDNDEITKPISIIGQVMTFSPSLHPIVYVKADWLLESLVFSEMEVLWVHFEWEGLFCRLYSILCSRIPKASNNSTWFVQGLTLIIMGFSRRQPVYLELNVNTVRNPNLQVLISFLFY